MKKIDNVLDKYTVMEENKIRGYHQYMKTKNIDILKESVNDFIDDTIAFRKSTIGESFLPFRLLDAKRNLKQCDDVKAIENFIIKVTHENMEIKDNVINELKRNYVMNDEYGVIESYINISNSMLNDSLNYMCEESSYIVECLENMRIITEADEENGKSVKETIKDGAKKVGTAAKNVGNKVFKALKEFLAKIKNMFKMKLNKLRERDLKWLQENKKAILNVKTDNIEVNVYDDYNKTYDDMISRCDRYINMLTGIKTSDPSVSSKLEQKEKQYSDKDGNLKQGLINFYRTGDPKKVSKVISLRGSQIKNSLNDMYDYCIAFLNCNSKVMKELSDLEKKVNDFEKEMERRNITENFCLVENDYIYNTDLALCENFHLLLENENNAKEPKVGVQQRDTAREEMSKISDNGVSGANKILRDQQLGLTSFLTVSEKKYFELIKILRALV